MIVKATDSHISIAEHEDALWSPQNIAVSAIEPHPDNLRTVFGDDELAALGASFANPEQLQPIHVQPIKDKPGRYRLLTGERRWRAAKLIGRKASAAYVRNIEPAQAAQILAERNLQHVALNPLDRARAYELLTRPKDKGGAGMTQTAIGKRLGQDPSNIANTMRLLKLPAEWQQRVAAGELGYRQAQGLVRFVDRPDVLAAGKAFADHYPAAAEPMDDESADVSRNNIAAGDDLADLLEGDETPPALLPLARRSAPVSHAPPRETLVPRFCRL